MKRVVMYINDRYNTIENILNYIKELTKAGHGFDVEIDPDDKEYHKHFYIDGDGADKIREIYVDDDKLRTMETDTAYECGKHANKWIPVSERLPNYDECIKNNGLFNVSDGNRTYTEWFDIYDKQRFGEPTMDGFRVDRCVTAWMPLPESYKPERERKE